MRKCIFHRLMLSGLVASLAAAPGKVLASDVAAEGSLDSMLDLPLSQLMEVVVTAQKRREKESDVPASISVVDAQRIEDQHVTQLTDLQGELPSVQITSYGTPGQTTVALRGIPTIGPGAVVGTYIDDIPLGSSNNFNDASIYVLDLLPYDISQIELLRGPQGTLYGAGTMGGLLKYVTTDPDLTKFGGRIGGGMATIDGGNGLGSDEHLTVNVPLIPNRLALRASFSNYQMPGWIDNSLTGDNGINSGKQQGARVAVLWKPDDDLSLKLALMRQTIDERDNSLVPLDPVTLAPLTGANVTAKPVAEPFKKTVDVYSVTVNWDLHWADFISASSISHSSTYQMGDETPAYGTAFPLFGNYPVGISAAELDLGLKKMTQEFRLASKQNGTLEWLAGAFYTNETGSNNQFASAQTTSGAPIPGLNPLFSAELPSTYRELALFADLTYKFTNRFDITTGFREARNYQEFSQIITAGSLVSLGTTNGSSSESVPTYMLSPRFHLSDDSMIYARIASGYRPGGPNTALPGVPPSVKSDTLVSDEIGLKSVFFDRRVSVDLAAYQIDWKDIQLHAATPQGVGYLANGATAQSRGIELTTALSPLDSWWLGFSTSYTGAYLTADAPAVSGRNGDALGGIPHWIASLTSTYNHPLPDGWAGRAGAAYAWTGYETMQVSSAPDNYRLPAVGILTVNAEASKDAWSIRLYAKNLTNSHVNTYLNPVSSAATGNVVQVDAVRPQPRTVGIEVDMQF